MLHADRLRDAMTERHLSQSELARRVGVTQTTIRKLASGSGYGSKYLHLIARELGTTPEYLTGETDDPCGDPPAAPDLGANERELLGCFAVLSQAQQTALLTIAMTMAGRGPAGRVHAPKHAFHADKRGKI